MDTASALADLSPPILDAKHLKQRLGLDDALTADILRVFLRDLPGRRKSLAEAVGERRTEAALQLVHTLKGTAANLAATRLSEAASGLEVALREGRDGATGGHRDALFLEMDLLEQFLRDFLAIPARQD